jgi:hypothetical protein
MQQHHPHLPHQPLSHRAAHVLTHWALTGLRRAERAVAGHARQLDQHSSRPFGLVVTAVQDPSAELRLLGLRGQLTLDTVDVLAEALATVPDGSALHIDVTDVAIGGAAVIDRCELLIDELELRRVRIRIVGLDPRHPALAGPRRP